MIFFLVKVFEQEEHARDFVNGAIFANRLSHFKKLEGDEGRETSMRVPSCRSAKLNSYT